MDTPLRTANIWLRGIDGHYIAYISFDTMKVVWNNGKPATKIPPDLSREELTAWLRVLHRMGG